MRAYLLILCTCIGFTTFASDDEEVIGEVWINGESFYKSIRHKKKSTLYFNEWSPFAEQFLADEEYYVALRLDESFDPLPKDDFQLPSLQTLAAIQDKEVTKKYLKFLESYGRTNGIQHMVLPDTSTLSPYQKDVIITANQLSPYYFLHEATLSNSIPDTKKAFEEERASSLTIWVTQQDFDSKKLQRWSQKLQSPNEDPFYLNLRKSKKKTYIPASKIPSDLAIEIFTSATTALDPMDVFPLQTNQLTYLGYDQNLKKRLNQYVQVLDYRMPGVPCLVDHRTYTANITDQDIILQVGLNDVEHSSINLPEVHIQNEDVVIAKMLFGALHISGRLDHANAKQVLDLGYLGYSDPSHVGMDEEKLQWVDSLALEAINQFATPGIQLTVLKGSDVVLNRSYGFYTYDSLMAVSEKTIYDVASLTKVMATLPAIALLIDQGKIHLDDSISRYLNQFSGSNKSSVTIRQLLAHQGGMRSYVPFWSMMMDGDRLDAFYYKTAEDEARDIRTYGMEPDPIMLDSLKSFIVKSRLTKNPDSYQYSDLGFMVLHLIVEEVSGQPFDDFLATNFYEPMGLTRTTFNPIRSGFSPKEIAPTEFDERYRNYQVWGEVHDRNALVFGGIAGHAGLFSTAQDLAKMMAMFMNDGFYGGKQYLKPATLDLLNARYFDQNRRGLGWDKKDGKKDSASDLASDTSYGHTGFTGTMVWADPAYDLIYVFLSNRIYPDSNNWKLGMLNTRTAIHDTLYRSLESFTHETK